jgi:hypothetical protein
VILVTGDRDWIARSPVVQALRPYPPGTVVVHGAAPGADSIAGEVADALEQTPKPYPADWYECPICKHRAVSGDAIQHSPTCEAPRPKPYFRRWAGPERNQRMLDANPEIERVLAFHNDLARSRGTADMVRRALKAGLPVTLYHSDGSHEEVSSPQMALGV